METGHACGFGVDRLNHAIQNLLQRAGSSYVAGPSIADARQVCERLGARGIATTVCYWNSRSESPIAVCENYLGLLDMIRGLANDCYLSVKASALEFDFELVKKLIDRAARTRTTIHFDSIGPDTVDRTFELIDAACTIYSNLGCTIPARWRRSVRDAEFAAAKGLHVRVVKGQWAGLNGGETDSREGFIRLIDSLIANSASHVAVATHNEMAGTRALTALRNASVSCELELLHGLPAAQMCNTAREHNVPVRVYVAYGYGALPYRLREFPRDPRILAWFARDLIRSGSK
ncbi:MAG TPA: hypothetical protein VGK48_03990 [Terriglobia bacterium]